MVYGQDFTEEELRRSCGSTRQVARITPCTLREGSAAGVDTLEFRTASGFNFTVVPSRGMDIAHADFRGMNLAWMSPAGITAPAFYEPAGTGWIRGFFGGLLTTCGLVHVGPPEAWHGEEQGLHGRISYTPATAVSHDSLWADGSLHLVAKGEMRESRVPHLNLLMQRSIRCRADEHRLVIHDRVTNEGFEKVPHQILYHVNAGFPVLTRNSYYAGTTQVVTPRDSAAADAKEHYRISNDPTPGFSEQVFIHRMAAPQGGRAMAAVINPEPGFSIGLYVKFDPKMLPYLIQWKMLGEGTYVMGIEPANTMNTGMEKQRALGTLRHISPGESLDYYLEIGVLNGAEEIALFEREVASVVPYMPDFDTQAL